MIVVIPSNREINFEYLSPLIDEGVRFIIVDDSNGSINIKHQQFSVYNWGHRKKILGQSDAFFPRKNGACRDFGFYMAWKESDKNEIIVALDDDCKIYHQDYIKIATSLLNNAPKPIANCTGIHLNILDCYSNIESNLFPRGFPYSQRGEYKEASFSEVSETEVKFILGLWKNVFDINGIDKINGNQYCYPDAKLKYESVVVKKGTLVSVCSMNMIFRRELIPIVYQLPMHIPVLPGWVVDRYGDIWGGFILKSLMDINGDGLAVGEPMVFHQKEGNFMKNIWQEHICHLLNDEFINILLEAKEEIDPGSYSDMMEQLLEQFKMKVQGSSDLLKPYFKILCKCLRVWLDALQIKMV